MFKIFSSLWIIAHIFHYSERWEHISITILLITLSTWAIIDYDKVRPLIINAIIVTIISLFKLPVLANHYTFYTVLNIFILLWLSDLHFLKKVNIRNPSIIESKFLTIKPYLSLSLIILYLMTGVNKLNYDFFNINVSCAVQFIERYYHFYPIPNMKFLYPIMPYLVIIIELFGAFCLMSRRLKILGISFFLLLHFFLVPISFYDFAAICYPLLILLLPTSLFKSKESTKQITKAILHYFIISMIGLFVTLVIIDADIKMSLLINYLQGLFILIASFVLFYNIAKILKKNSYALFSHYRLFEKNHSFKNWYFVLPLFITFITTTSYTGLQTLSNGSMFSNLRTTPPFNNHFFIPASFQVFDYQKDYVYLVSAFLPRQKRDKNASGITPEYIHGIELSKKLIQFRDKGESVPMIIKLRNGEVKSYKDIVDQKEWRERYNWIERKLIALRPIGKEGPKECSW